LRLLVLAGGFGTRLKSAVSEVPKALAPVGNDPFLKLQIINWKKQGINSFVFLLYHQAEIVVNFLEKEQRDGSLNDCEIDCLIEPIPMGTGGAIAYAIDKLNLRDNFLVANGDTWLSSGVIEVSQAIAPAIGVVKLSDVSRYGSVKFNQQNFISSFQEKNNHNSGWINAGLFQLNAELFYKWNHLPFSLEQEMFPIMVADSKLRVVLLETDFIDIGIPEDYYRFCQWISKDRKGLL